MITDVLANTYVVEYFGIESCCALGVLGSESFYNSLIGDKIR